MEKDKHFTLQKINLKLIGAGFLIIIVGFLLMLGPASGVEFNPDIFSTRRITIGPMISLFGFLFVVFAILYKPQKEETEK